LVGDQSADKEPTHLLKHDRKTRKAIVYVSRRVHIKNQVNLPTETRQVCYQKLALKKPSKLTA